MTLEPLDAGRPAEAAAVWNATFGRTHPLTTRGWDAWWASPDADGDLAWGAVDASGALVGFALARAPRRPWAPADLGHVSLLAVQPSAQGTGVGARLWEAAIAALQGRGRTRVRLGADPERLLPGVPLSAPRAAWRFFRARGVRPGGLESDLLLDLGPPVEGRPLPPEVRLVDDTPTAAMGFVAEAFPGRWADEVERYVAAGTSVLTLWQDETAIGFCVAARRDDPSLAPALTWASSLPGVVGGLGPLGLSEAVRGSGLGAALVAEAARWQRARGATAVVIDWTDLTSFYGRLGAHVWRVYQRAEVHP